MTAMHHEECCECGVAFAFPSTLYEKLAKRKPGTAFYCPNGHAQHYLGESWETKLRREKQRREQMAAQVQDAENRADRERRSAAAYKGAATRLKNRARAGVCPCCNRTFKDLARHMKSQHPDQELNNVVEIGQVS